MNLLFTAAGLATWCALVDAYVHHRYGWMIAFILGALGTLTGYAEMQRLTFIATRRD